MKRKLRIATYLAAGLALSLPAVAMDHGKMDHGAKAETAAPASSEKHGVEIRSAKAEGYAVKYNLIDMAEMMKGQPMAGHDMSKMKSHHLMVYFTAPDGKAAAEGKVGYAITGPDKADQKTMAMAMEGGFGADVELKAKGAYKIKTKAVFGEKTVTDEFTYTVK